MSNETKTREELERENRALRASLKAYMGRRDVHVFRAEFTLDADRGALLTVTAPSLSPEREMAFGRVFAEAFAVLLELDGTRDEGRSIGRGDEVVKP